MAALAELGPAMNSLGEPPAGFVEGQTVIVDTPIAAPVITAEDNKHDEEPGIIKDANDNITKPKSKYTAPDHGDYDYSPANPDYVYWKTTSARLLVRSQTDLVSNLHGIKEGLGRLENEIDTLRKGMELVNRVNDVGLYLCDYGSREGSLCREAYPSTRAPYLHLARGGSAYRDNSEC